MASNADDSMNDGSMLDSVNCIHDLHALSRRLEVQFSFMTQHEVCSICSGYYGPCFGEPVCATCHAFLFPEDLGQAEPRAVFESWKKDDGDSGNDEPNDPFFGPERRHSSIAATPSQPQPAPVAEPRCGAPEEAAPPDPAEEPETPPDPPVPAPVIFPPAVPPRAVDRLAERLRLLSLPREPDLRPGFMDLLLVVFRYLDDMSLCAASSVCRRWQRLLEAHITNEQWQTYTLSRWPLFRPLHNVKNWWLCYKQLVESAPCKLCLQQMALQCQPTGMRVDPPEGIQAIPLDRECCHWLATILGPQSSPYAGGIFYLYLQVPYSYPLCPPMVRFVTRIFHPNVSRHGDIGIDLIHYNWLPAMTVTKVLISVQSLLTDPFCQVCMEPSIGQLYQRDKACFDLLARTWTWKYAMHDALSPLES
ncbi:hypothetical protein B566_EDAN004819 [Ephemera danica]|nr:hypothetical protein B566_EDAN004819 [Ephemera danica]